MHYSFSTHKILLFSALLLSLSIYSVPKCFGQHSVAREWNEALLEAIRGDYARPTVHARNLFHVSAAMYDAWAVFDTEATPWLLGQTVNGFSVPFEGFTPNEPLDSARDLAVSYAAYRLLQHRFRDAPERFTIALALQDLMVTLGYDPNYLSNNYTTGHAAALGNYIADAYIEFGLQDGSNEEGEYANQYYEPTNEPILIEDRGNPLLTDPNRWQPIAFELFIDQSGNVVGGQTPPFLSPEWGSVVPFALERNDLSVWQRDSNDYWVYHDPGPPPHLSLEENTSEEAEYKWGFELVTTWSSHLDPTDGVMWDISPNSIGNIASYPTSLEEYHSFYKRLAGGDASQGYDINPATQEPYAEQMVPRGDYARVLAEFWADGPDSETPPGHWFTILNYVNDHPSLVKKIGGAGEVVSDLEWDIKSYFTLGGAMHDAAVSVWGIKGYYDYIRPVSAIRWMAGQGQSSDPSLPNYNANGIRLIPGFIELTTSSDGLGAANQIKIRAWKGPDFINDPEVDEAGVGWILAENWWPYQRPTFVTPPFAGYISGHSTFSSAAAEVLALFTGDEYFPGGMGEFVAPMNEFLVFEEGPSVDVILQWATYRDASDQCSLSRIWGGIHPPVDDIPGRFIGIDIGTDATNKAFSYFENRVTDIPQTEIQAVRLWPNPVASGSTIHLQAGSTIQSVALLLPDGRTVATYEQPGNSIELKGIPVGWYLVKVVTEGKSNTQPLVIR